jgi:hypothetical protein
MPLDYEASCRESDALAEYRSADDARANRPDA